MATKVPTSRYGIGVSQVSLCYQQGMRTYKQGCYQLDKMKLVQHNCQNAKWTNKAHGEEKQLIEAETQCSPV